mgnify:CR=1 FL=1
MPIKHKVSSVDEWFMQEAMDTVTSMTVDEFQNECDKHFIVNNVDDYVFDLAKALMRSKENGR